MEEKKIHKIQESTILRLHIKYHEEHVIQD